MDNNEITGKYEKVIFWGIGLIVVAMITTVILLQERVSVTDQKAELNRQINWTMIDRERDLRQIINDVKLKAAVNAAKLECLNNGRK